MKKLIAVIGLLAILARVNAQECVNLDGPLPAEYTSDPEANPVLIAVMSTDAQAAYYKATAGTCASPLFNSIIGVSQNGHTWTEQDKKDMLRILWQYTGYAHCTDPTTRAWILKQCIGGFTHGGNLLYMPRPIIGQLLNQSWPLLQADLRRNLQ